MTALNITVGILKYPPDYAGDGMRLHRTFLRLKQKGNVGDVHVLTSWVHEETKNQTLDGIHIYRPVECTLKSCFKNLSKKITLPLQALKLTFQYLRLLPKTDLVLTSGSGWFPSFVAWLAFLTQKPVVKEIVLLGSDDPQTIQKCKPFLFKWFFLAPFHFCKLIVAISPRIEKACLDSGISADKIWSRFNPVDFQMEEITEMHGSQREVPVIFWVGAITRRKNVAFLMEAASHLKKPAVVRFAGPHYDPAYFQELEEIKHKVPAHIRVEFLGHIENRSRLRDLYLSSDLFWFASKKEGMGNVVAESLVCGTPVLATPVMGIMEQVIPNAESGEIIDTEDPEVFARAAERWLEKNHDRLSISKEARQRFDITRVDNQYCAWFDKIINAGKNTDSKTIDALIPGRI
jgi:glycosyltransferase involved in cell wall biosynthesis